MISEVRKAKWKFNVRKSTLKVLFGKRLLKVASAAANCCIRARALSASGRGASFEGNGSPSKDANAFITAWESGAAELWPSVGKFGGVGGGIPVEYTANMASMEAFSALSEENVAFAEGEKAANRASSRYA